MCKSEAVLKNKTYKILWDFEIKTNQPIPGRRLCLIKNKKKNTCGFSCSTRQQNGNKGNQKYLDHARELKQLWNMRVTVISIIIGTIPQNPEKRLDEQEIQERNKTLQTTAMLRLAGILTRILENWGDLLLFRLQ